MNLFGLRRLTVGLLLFGVSASGSHASSVAFWHGQSGGYQIDWSPSNLKVYVGSTVVLDMAARSQLEWKAFVQKRPHDRYYQADYNYEVLSIVGSVMTVKTEIDCDCGAAHPTVEIIVEAYDLSKIVANQPSLVSLTNFFDPKDLLTSLVNDSVVRSHLSSNVGIESLGKLVDALVPSSKNTNNSDSCSLDLTLVSLRTSPSMTTMASAWRFA